MATSSDCEEVHFEILQSLVEIRHLVFRTKNDHTALDLVIQNAAFSHQTNMIQVYTKKCIKDENIVHCCYFPAFFKDNKQIIYEALKCEVLKSHSMMDIGQRWNCPIFANGEYREDVSPTFTKIKDALSVYFDCEFIDGVLNHYADGQDFIPPHFDFYFDGINMTVGASFGGQRTLEFWNPTSGHSFSIPQRDGDVFMFTNEINKTFKHSVPKLLDELCQPRFSVILLGKKR